MKVFVSGKVGHEADTRYAINRLLGLGHDITFDWTQIPHLKPYEENRLEASRAATLEIEGVRLADQLLLLLDDRGVGMYVELGVALSLRKPVIAVSTGPLRSMFLFHPLVTIVSTIDQAIAALDEVSKEHITHV